MIPKDQHILNAIFKGAQKAQQELCKKMIGISYRYSNNSEDAKDILQKDFVKVYSNLKKYNFTDSLEGWIRRRILNTASD